MSNALLSYIVYMLVYVKHLAKISVLDIRANIMALQGSREDELIE